MNNDGTESTLHVIPSKYIIKRQELRNLIEMRKRYVLYFRLVKDSYGKASVIDLKRADDNHKLTIAKLEAENVQLRDQLDIDRGGPSLLQNIHFQPSNVTAAQKDEAPKGLVDYSDIAEKSRNK